MKHPAPSVPVIQPLLHRRWIEYRMLRGESDNELQESLTALDLPCPKESVLKAIRTALAAPKGFAWGARNKATTDYLKEPWQLELAKQTPTAKLAIDILECPRIRELVEVASLVSAPNAELLATLARLHAKVSVDAIGLYRLLAFDYREIARAQLRVMVTDRVALGLQRVMGKGDESRLRRAIASDSRVIAVAMNASPIAWFVAMMRAGFAPARLDLRGVVGVLEATAALRAAESLFAEGRHAARNAEGFTKVLLDLRQIQEKLASPEDAISKLAQMAVECDDQPMKTIDELIREKGGALSDGRVGTPEWKSAMGSPNDTIES
jgi:hypothetical protein